MKLRVQIDDQSYEVEVGDLNSKPVLVSVDGETFQVWLEENGKAPLAAAGPAASAPVETAAPVIVPAAKPAPVAAGDRMKNVTAPIPGVILTIAVKEGDMITFGQELCVLEAMKMKNQIRANRAGKIGAIHVSPGDQVKHNQVLMSFTD